MKKITILSFKNLIIFNYFKNILSNELVSSIITYITLTLYIVTFILKKHYYYYIKYIYSNICNKCK